MTIVCCYSTAVGPVLGYSLGFGAAGTVVQYWDISAGNLGGFAMGRGKEREEVCFQAEDEALILGKTGEVVRSEVERVTVVWS